MPVTKKPVKTPKKPTPDTTLESQEKVVNMAVNATKGWRTIAANGLFLIPFLIEALGYVIGSPEIKAIIPNEYLPAFGVFVGIANIFLRTQTTTPIGKKQ